MFISRLIPLSGETDLIDAFGDSGENPQVLGRVVLRADQEEEGVNLDFFCFLVRQWIICAHLHTLTAPYQGHFCLVDTVGPKMW